MAGPLIKKMLGFITYREGAGREDFILRENLFDQQKQAEKKSSESAPGTKAPRRRKIRKVSKTGEGTLSGRGLKSGPEGRLSADLGENRRRIEEIYDLPANKDITFRVFTLGTDPPVPSMAVFMDGLADKNLINPMLQDLMVFAGSVKGTGGHAAELVLKRLLASNQAKLVRVYDELTGAINFGDTAFFFQGSDAAIVAETKGWKHRGVERPQNEQTLYGPQESFNELLRDNTSLIRKFVRSEKLNIEYLSLGSRFKNEAALIYVRDLANPALVEEARRRLRSIDYDYISDTGILEQFIEDSPFNLNPQTFITERPDRVVSCLAEGKVAILLNGSPQAIVVPVTMFSQLHTGEESYLRWQYGTFIRYIRNLSFYIALLLPGIYLAVVLFHQEMIPTELLLAIAGNREQVPFPTLIELLLMEFSFELVREASIRIPGIVGTTIGIVGALILGQAAVQANIVSPILVILVAVTGLASFAIPYYSLSFALRIYRFFYILMGALLGFFGITIALFINILLTVNLKSFGVPYLAPAAPRTYAGPDIVTRLPYFLHRRRPDYFNPLDDVRSNKDPRGWVKE